MELLDDTQGGGEDEIGWHLHPAYQRQGLVTEGAKALLRAATDNGIDHVLALTDPDNVRSQPVALRLGTSDLGITDRWFGLSTRQFRLTLAVDIDASHDDPPVS